MHNLTLELDFIDNLLPLIATSYIRLILDKSYRSIFSSVNLVSFVYFQNYRWYLKLSKDKLKYFCHGFIFMD